MFITISRQFAAGASLVASQVAETLDWAVVDDAFIREIAARSDYAPEEVAALEERVPSFIERFAQSAALSLPENLISSPSWIDRPETLKLARVTRDVVAVRGPDGKDSTIYIAVPKSTRFVAVQLTYRDGSVSPVKRYKVGN